MLKIQDDVVLVEIETERLEGYRLEDPSRAPAIIVFINEEEPQLVPLERDAVVPTKIKSLNMEAEIQIITYDEVKATLAQR